MPNDELYTVKQAAIFLNQGEDVVRLLIRADKLRAWSTPLRADTLVRKSDLVALRQAANQRPHARLKSPEPDNTVHLIDPSCLGYAGAEIAMDNPLLLYCGETELTTGSPLLVDPWDTHGVYGFDQMHEVDIVTWHDLKTLVCRDCLLAFLQANDPKETTQTDREEVINMGGKPQTSTPKDKRLKENKMPPMPKGK